MNRDSVISLFSMTVMRLIFSTNKECLFSYLSLLFGCATIALRGHGSGDRGKVNLGVFGKFSVQFLHQVVYIILSVVMRSDNGIHFLPGKHCSETYRDVVFQVLRLFEQLADLLH